MDKINPVKIETKRKETKSEQKSLKGQKQKGISYNEGYKSILDKIEIPAVPGSLDTSEQGDLLEEDGTNLSDDRCKSGTMRHVNNDEIIDIYTNGLDSVSNVKVDYFLSRINKRAGALIVDIGCMKGKVLHEMFTKHPDMKFEGIDSDERYIKCAQETYPRHKFTILKLPNKPLPYKDNEVDAFTISAVIHEIYTYNKFSEESVKKSLGELYRTLKPGGRVIIREPAMPQKPNELLYIKLSSTDGANPSTEKTLLAAAPKELSSASKMKRFLIQFEPLHFPQNQAIKEQITKSTDDSYKLHAWLISEFLRKRQCYPKEYWNAEMGEHNGPFTCDDLKKLAKAAGFQEEKIHIQYCFEDAWYGTIKDGEGISIAAMNGESVKQQERLPSHIYAILEK